MELKQVEKQEKSIVVLTIGVSAAELEVGKQKAFKKNAKNIMVPGFRKGKAPRQIIEKLYGAGMFVEDAINLIYPEVLEQAVQEAQLKQVGPADVEMKDFNDDGGFVFEAKVPVSPEVEIGTYKGIKAEKGAVSITETEVQTELERMAQRTARTETVERAAQNGDTVTIDFEGFIDGVAFEGGKGENHNLVLGSNSFIPGFEEQLIGKSAGDSCDVNVSFPAEYHAQELKGKAAVFQCKVHAVQQTVLPEMDDEFAKDVSETSETLADLKKEIETRLTTAAQEQADHDFEEKVIDGLLEGLKADIPDVMIEAQIDNIMQDFAYRLQMQGMTMQQYVEMNGMDIPAFRGMFREQAERQVKTRLTLTKIADLEDITIDDATLEEEYAKMAESYSMELDRIKNMVKPDALRGDLRLTKALDFAKENVKPLKATRAKSTKKAAETEE